MLTQRTSGKTSACLLLGVLVTLATACQSGQGTAGGGPGGPGAEPAGGAPQPRVNRLTFGIPPVPTTVTSFESNNTNFAHSTSYWPMAPMYEFLIGVTAEGQELVPQLATEWSLDPDGKSYRFKLKKGIPFHYGQGELTAKDVRFSWEDMKTEPNPSFGGQKFIVTNQIKDVELVSDQELVIRLADRDAGFLPGISQAENIFPIGSKADGNSRTRRATLDDKPYAGTGPYRYLERQQGQYLRYERPPGTHWRQTPDFPEFEFRFIKENSTILAALLAGETQVAALPQEMVLQAEQAGLKAIPGKAAGFHALLAFFGVWVNQAITPQMVLNSDPKATFVFPNSPLMDVRVRKALNKAIDRDALNKAFIGGKGQPIYNQYFHSSRPGWNPQWERNFKEAYGYDPEAARKLLTEAGYGPGRQLSTTVRLVPSPYFPATLDMDEAIASMWRAVGIDVKLDQTDPLVAAGKSARGEWDNHSHVVITSIRQLNGVTVYNGIRSGVRSGAQLPELNDLFDRIRVTLDQREADGLWRKWGDTAYEQYVNGPLFWLPAYATVNPKIVGDYVFPGSISGTFTHVEYIKAAP